MKWMGAALLCFASGCAGLVPAGPGGTAAIGATDLDGTRRLIPDPTADVTVLIFITVDCPIANGYAPEIRSIREAYEPRGVRFLLVHVDPDVTVAMARRHADDYGHAGPILLDGQQRLVSWTGATITPEAAVLTPDGQLVYRGRIDNWYADLGKKRREPTIRDLRGALDAVLRRQPVPNPRTEPVGCYIPDVTNR